MYLQTLLIHRLKDECLLALAVHPDLQDEEQYTRATRLLTEKLQRATITNRTLRRPTESTTLIPVEDRCEARTWSSHTGERCSRRACEGYCRIHQKMLEEKGYLVFGRYDEERPVFNEKGNRIPWYDESPWDAIDIILKYQQAELDSFVSREGG